MDIDSCYQVGYVIKRHGLKGDVKVHLDEPLPKKLESIFVEIDNRLIPFFIEQVSVMQDQAIFKFEDVSTPEQADKLAKHSIYLPLKSKNKAQSKSLNINDLVGYEVHFQGSSIGQVKWVNDHALNPLLVIPSKEKEILIPINDYFIKKIDNNKRIVNVDLPEGFLEI